MEPVREQVITNYLVDIPSTPEVEHVSVVSKRETSREGETHRVLVGCQLPFFLSTDSTVEQLDLIIETLQWVKQQLQQ